MEEVSKAKLREYAIEAGKKCEGNHRNFESFGWRRRPEDDRKWAIVYHRNRDSGLLERVNADIIDKAMAPHVDENNCRGESHNHWACGWIDGYAIRVFQPGTEEPTPAWLARCELAYALEDYPCLDDEALSAAEYEEQLNCIKLVIRGEVPKQEEDEWAGKIFSYLWDNEQEALDYSDREPSVKTASVNDALEKLKGD